MIRLARKSERIILAHANANRTSLNNIARIRSPPRRHLIPTPGLPQTSKCSCARAVLRMERSGVRVCFVSDVPAIPYVPRDDRTLWRARRMQPPSRRAYVSVAYCSTEPKRGSGRGRKRAQRMIGPLPYMTECQYMRRSEKRITPGLDICVSLQFVFVCPGQKSLSRSHISSHSHSHSHPLLFLYTRRYPFSPT